MKLFIILLIVYLMVRSCCGSDDITIYGNTNYHAVGGRQALISMLHFGYRIPIWEANNKLHLVYCGGNVEIVENIFRSDPQIRSFINLGIEF